MVIRRLTALVTLAMVLLSTGCCCHHFCHRRCGHSPCCETTCCAPPMDCGCAPPVIGPPVQPIPPIPMH
jgi:hypothetical protein